MHHTYMCIIAMCIRIKTMCIIQTYIRVKDHTYMHASGSSLSITDMCIIHTCIRVKDGGS